MTAAIRDAITVTDSLSTLVPMLRRCLALSSCFTLDLFLFFTQAAAFGIMDTSAKKTKHKHELRDD